MLLSESANTKRVSAPLVLQTVIPFLPVPEITRSSTSPLPPVELGPRYNLPLVSKVAAVTVEVAAFVFITMASFPSNVVVPRLSPSELLEPYKVPI